MMYYMRRARFVSPEQSVHMFSWQIVELYNDTSLGMRFLQASMLEIYNEEYKDLLGKTLPAGKKHQVSHQALLTTTCIVATP